MKKEQIEYLYGRFLQKSLTAEELKEFKSILIDPASEPTLIYLLDERWELLNIDELPNVPELIDQKVYNDVMLHNKQAKNVFSLWPRIAVAIIVIFALCSGLMVYINQKNKIENNEQTIFGNDVGPGKHSATLTLANGEKIRLGEYVEGKIANEAGVNISKSIDGEIIYSIEPNQKEETNSTNTLSTAKGEIYTLVLPDKSKVWLNSASRITYNTSLYKNGKRIVFLDGEAYFQVAKDAKHPFIVKSLKQEVEVLGTHFNVSAYKDEVISTTLLEGAVKINQKIILQPNEQAIVSEHGISVVKVFADSFVDWKDGVFSFERERLQSIMNKVARWYDVEVVYQDGNISSYKQTYTGTISKSENISSVLKALHELGGVNFQVTGRTVRVLN